MTLRKFSIWIFLTALLIPLSTFVIRVCYPELLDPEVVHPGIATRADAYLGYEKLGAITGILAGLGALTCLIFQTRSKYLAAVISASLTLVLLWTYTFLALSESQFFCPAVDSVNGHFFYEYNFLTYAFMVALPIAVASGLVTIMLRSNKG